MGGPLTFKARTVPIVVNDGRIGSYSLNQGLLGDSFRAVICPTAK